MWLVRESTHSWLDRFHWECKISFDWWVCINQWGCLWHLLPVQPMVDVCCPVIGPVLCSPDEVWTGCQWGEQCQPRELWGVMGTLAWLEPALLEGCEQASHLGKVLSNMSLMLALQHHVYGIIQYGNTKYLNLRGEISANWNTYLVIFYQKWYQYRYMIKKKG